MSYFQELVKEALVFWFPEQEILENHKPDWLHGMELDFYLPKKKLAIEVQGHQHYNYIPCIHGSKKEFYALIKRDKLKMRSCKSREITLIVISVQNKAVAGGLATKLCKLFGKAMPKLPESYREKYKGHLATMHAMNTTRGGKGSRYIRPSSTRKKQQAR